MRMNRKKKTTDVEAEVEELLKVVEDEILLNLSVNSHVSRVSPNYIDSDLDRRFRALKSHSSSSSFSVPNNPPPPDTVLGEDVGLRSTKIVVNDQDDDDGEEEDEDDQVEKLIQWAKDAARLDPSPPSDEDEDEDDGDTDYNEDEEDDHRTVK